LTSHSEKSVLAVHRCTARNSTGCYAESGLATVNRLLSLSAVAGEGLPSENLKKTTDYPNVTDWVKML
jgi:hypothetical protein